jgi:hypothetical protein
MTFQEWWKNLNEFWEANDIPPDLERVAVARGAWDAAVKECAKVVRDCLLFDSQRAVSWHEVQYVLTKMSEITTRNEEQHDLR